MVDRAGREAVRDAAVVAVEPGAASVGEIRRLLVAGDSKAALKQARVLHRQEPNGETEAALVDACIARIRGLLDRGLRPEAQSLVELLPRPRALESARALEVARVLAAFGDVGPLVEPLADASLPEAQRRLIESSIEQVVADPAAIADCPLLPQDHPLRRGAAAISEALAAVTSGAPAREPPSLDAIPRRGPLAGWKLLVRAVHLVGRGDVAGCIRCLAMIDPQSAPGQLIPVLRAVAQPDCRADLAGPAAALLRRVQPDQGRLREDLDRLDRAMRSDRLTDLGKLIRAAIVECERVRPDLLDHLRQGVSVLGVLEECPTSMLRSALGKPASKDARFWRAYAVALQMKGNPVQACAAWDRFIRHAVHQGWFSAEGTEAAGVLLHMAGLMSRLTREHLAAARRHYAQEFDGFAGMYGDQPKAIRELGPARGERADLYFMEPDELYRRASLRHPRADVFAAWLAWAGQHDPRSRKPTDAAEAWHESFPDDPRPLVALMDAAEQRGALKTALRYLDRAEAMDALNPQVRRARFRLWVATALRHVRGGNDRLAASDLRALDAMPQAAEGDRRALVEALRAVAAEQSGEPGLAQGARAQAAALLESEAGADVLIAAIASGCGRSGAAAGLRGRHPSASAAGPLVAGVARAVAVAQEAGLQPWVPASIQQRIIEELDRAPHADAGQVLRLAEWALRGGNDELAYSAAGAGLRAGGVTPLRARLLLARAMAIPDAFEPRKPDLLRAAGTVARQSRDESTAASAFQQYRQLADPFDDDDLEEVWKQGLDARQLQAIIDAECRARAYPRKGPKGRRGWQPTPLLIEDSFDFEPPSRRVPSRIPGPPRRRGAAPRDDRAEASAAENDVPDHMIEEMGTGSPGAVIRVLEKIAARHMGPDGKMPDPGTLARENPELAQEMLAALAALNDSMDDRGPPRPPARKQRKRRSR